MNGKITPQDAAREADFSILMARMGAKPRAWIEAEEQAEIDLNLAQAIGICRGVAALLRESGGKDSDAAAGAVCKLLERIQTLRANKQAGGQGGGAS